MKLSISDLQNWYSQNKQQILRDFFTFLSFPSISTDPAYAVDCRKTAEWLRSYLAEIGLNATLWEGSGHPCVFATHMHAKNKPTLLIYHHYDVQPVDPLELWKTPPFSPNVKDNKVFARGASDNKGQCFYTLTALKAFFTLCRNADINLKIFIEGEEESGEKGTIDILSRHGKELQADYLLIIDAGVPNPHTPAITLGIRGMCAMEVSVRNSSTDLHSGVHGGIALNPNRILATALGKLWDSDGKVAIEGFYDDVAPILRDELSQLTLDFDEAKYKEQFGIHALSQEKGISPIEANWLRPTLEINGMYGGYTGTGFKTVIPAIAHAKISCRLVPNQDPMRVCRLLELFLRRHIPIGVDLSVEFDHGAPAFRTSMDSDVVKLVKGAFEDVFTSPSQFILCGASIPIVIELAKVTSAQIALIGMGMDTDDIHAPNENFGLDRLEKGFLTMGMILNRLANG